jgi:hypothetical protein
MPLVHVHEEQEVSPDVRRIYDDVRASFDLPFVPSLFKVAAGRPEYLKLLWDDLGPVVRSREFQTASKALEEFVRSLVISGGWKFSDQQKQLTAQKFSYNDIEQLGAVVATFARSVVRMVLFTRLAQRGFSGGQAGRVSNGRQASALSRLVTLHVPNESEAGLRTWLIYSDIKRTLGARSVLSLYRVLAPFPGYLASVWLESKKMFAEPAFLHARDDVSKRALALLVGLPVKDHRVLGKQIDPREWRDIEEMVDSFARILPQFALLSAAWQRSFPHFTGQIVGVA